MTRKQATIAVRSGLNDDEQYGCVVPPIHLSSTYNFTGFNEPRAHDYSRRGNPTRDVVQRALAELEGGAGKMMSPVCGCQAKAGTETSRLRISSLFFIVKRPCIKSGGSQTTCSLFMPDAA